MAAFPLANALRGRAGEVLKKPVSRGFRIHTSADLPAGAATEFLPSTGGESIFHPLLPVQVLEGGQVLEVAFSRPVYPPSVRLEAFLLTRQLGMTPIALRRVEILGRPGRFGPGSVLRLYPARALTPGLYILSFQPGSEGIQDYGGEGLLVPSTFPGQRWNQGGPLTFAVEEKGLSSPFQEDLRQRAPVFDMDPEGVGLPVDMEGGLRLTSTGLRFPDLEFSKFQSHGPLSVEERMVILEPERPLPGEQARLGSQWDFDSLVVRRGCKLIVMLDRDLEIRIAGRFSVEGELLFRLGGKARALGGKRSGLFRGDPRPTWAEIHPRVRILVGGLCRLEGAMGLYQESEPGPGEARARLVPGYLWGRGPFFGNWGASRLQSWIRTPQDASEPRALRPTALPGRWGWLGPWHALEPSHSFKGEVTLLGATQDLTLELLVQGRHENGRLSSWVLPDVLPQLGRLSALRAALYVDGSDADTGLLLQGMGIR